MCKIKVMLVDDQIILREGLKTIINLQPDMEVMAEADNGIKAIEMMNSNKIDVILMDISMPEMNGVDATFLIKKQYPDTSIIILTTFDDDDYIIDGLAKGASGYLLKDIDGIHLVNSIRDVYKGQLMLPSKVATKLALHISAMNNSPEGIKHKTLMESHILSEREKEIGRLMADGLNNGQIARKLYLSEGTVKNYISEIYQKLGTNNRTKAAMLIKQMLE